MGWEEIIEIGPDEDFHGMSHQPYEPNLNPTELSDFVRHLPPNRWSLPDTPYAQGVAQIIADFIEKASAGQTIVEQATQGILSGSRKDLEAYEYFQWVMAGHDVDKSLLTSIQNSLDILIGKSSGPLTQEHIQLAREFLSIFTAHEMSE